MQSQCHSRPHPLCYGCIPLRLPTPTVSDPSRPHLLCYGCIPLRLPTPHCHQHLSLINLITTDICRNIMAKLLQGKMEKLLGQLQIVGLLHVGSCWPSHVNRQEPRHILPPHNTQAPTSSHSSSSQHSSTKFLIPKQSTAVSIPSQVCYSADLLTSFADVPSISGSNCLPQIPVKCSSRVTTVTYCPWNFIGAASRRSSASPQIQFGSVSLLTILSNLTSTSFLVYFIKFLLKVPLDLL
jgi:hypothetical protein